MHGNMEVTSLSEVWYIVAVLYITNSVLFSDGLISMKVILNIPII